MRTNILPALRLTLVCLVAFSGIYTGIVYGMAQLVPESNQQVKTAKGHYENIAQKFQSDRYFWSRPSAVNYNAAGSGGSNKAPSNAEYLKEVQQRIDTFLKHHPRVSREQIPSEIVTASGSGLDPHLSAEAALIQVERVAEARGLKTAQVRELVLSQIEKPLLGLFGPEKVNVLKLNLNLDKLSASK